MEDQDVAAGPYAGEPLTDDEAWQLLAREPLGRLAYHVGDEVDIAPVNHVVDGRRVLFRTAAGSKLYGVVVGRTVAFEVDRVEVGQAASVVLRGMARVLGDDEAGRADALGLRPWVGSEKPEVVAVEPGRVTGRRFALES